MVGPKHIEPMHAELVDEDIELSLAELCDACELPAERIVEFVAHGVIEPAGSDPERWRFQGLSVFRLRRARRLEADLGINLAGVALALDLLDELDEMRARLQRLEGLDD